MFGKHLFRNTFAVLCIVSISFHYQSCLYRDVVFFFPKKGLNGCVHLRVIENSSLSSSSFGELVVACHVDWSRYNLYCIVARLEEFFWCKIFSLKKEGGQQTFMATLLWSFFFATLQFELSGFIWD